MGMGTVPHLEDTEISTQHATCLGYGIYAINHEVRYGTGRGRGRGGEGRGTTDVRRRGGRPGPSRQAGGVEWKRLR